MTVAYHGHAVRLWPRTAARRWTGSHRPSGPALGAGEHRLLRTSSSDGTGQYVATERAVYRRADGNGAWLRIAWIDIARVEHSRPGELILRPWPDGGEPVRLLAGATSRLGLLAQERVGACQVLLRRIDLGNGAGAVITALREPGTGEIGWGVHVIGSPGHDDPATRASIDHALRELRSQAGC